MSIITYPFTMTWKGHQDDCPGCHWRWDVEDKLQRLQWQSGQLSWQPSHSCVVEPPWWCHNTETLYSLLTLCEGKPLVDFPSHKSPAKQGYGFFYVSLKELLDKQSSCKWFEMSWYLSQDCIHPSHNVAKLRLLHNPSLVAVGPTVGMRHGLHHPLVLWLAGLNIDWGCLSHNAFWADMTGGNFHQGHWQSPCMAQMAGKLPTVRAMQRDCERVYVWPAISAAELLLMKNACSHLQAISHVSITRDVVHLTNDRKKYAFN